MSELDIDKLQRAIKICAKFPKRYCNGCEYSDGFICFHDELMEDIDKAVAMLKAQEPHVLTWEEMVEAGKNHDAVYLEEHENAYQKRFWGIAIEGIEPPEHGYNYPGGTQFNVVDADDDMWDGDLYGLDTTLGWRAWNRKPTEEQMKAVEWK